jgi:pimeloyl-ACP methyl ester carboxylesterase
MGHSVRRVSLTGMGERLHLSSPDVDLETHIQDAVNAILWDQLDDVVLVGHSYGGMVVTGVADRIPDRIKRVVYIDALLPLSGESAMEIIAPWIVDLIMETEQDGMSMLGADDSDEMPRGVAQPMKTFTQAIDLRNAPGSIVPARYILTVESDDGSDAFKNNADRADSLGIEVEVMKANHNPEKSAPQELVRRLVAQ